MKPELFDIVAESAVCCISSVQAMHLQKIITVNNLFANAQLDQS